MGALVSPFHAERQFTEDSRHACSWSTVRQPHDSRICLLYMALILRVRSISSKTQQPQWRNPPMVRRPTVSMKLPLSAPFNNSHAS